MNGLEPLSTDEATNYRDFMRSRYPSTRDILRDLEPRILLAYDQYESAVTSSSFSALSLTDNEAAALRSNYLHTSPRSSMYRIREAILSLAPLGRCPYCEIGQVSTLDHYLPKSQFAEFSVLCLNLIPACYRCNIERGDQLLADGTRFWHAYLDDVPDIPVLFAEVRPALSTVSIEFRIENRSRIDSSSFARLELLFHALRLDEYYADEATQALFDLAFDLSKTFSSEASSGVKNYLEALATDSGTRRGPNHWRTALCECLARIDDFTPSHFDALVRSVVP